MEQNTSKVLAADADRAAPFMHPSDANSAPGTSLFVINLCASMAPIANVAKSLPGLEAYRLYQVTRREDGRTRYRLRLGFFTSEADAEAILVNVRETYPTAFTACLGDEDAKFARNFTPQPSPPPKIQIVDTHTPTAVVTPKPASASQPAKAAAQATTVAPATKPNTSSIASTQQSQPAHSAASKTPAKAAPAKPVTAAPMPPVAKSAAGDINEIELSWDPPAPTAPASPASDTMTATSARVTTEKATQLPRPPAAAGKATPPAPSAIKPPSPAPIELTLEQDPAPAPQAPAPVAGDEPFRVGRGIDIPATSLTLETAPTPQSPAAASAQPKKTAAPATATAKTPPLSTAAEMSRLKAAHASASATVKAAVMPGAQIAQLPDLDSTQTIRALTSDELADESQDKWFSIQLVASDQPVNLDAMPRLDIFEAYRLYSVALAGSGKITHSLRIGFFREEVSAEAVCGYLKTFFNSPSVVRISIAEHARFKDPPAPKPAPKADVLDLSHARDRSAKPVPTVTMEVQPPRFDPNATGRFKTSTTGMHKALSTGSHKALAATGTHRALGATGTHKSLQAASKAALPPTKRSAPLAKTSATGKHKSLQSKKSLTQQLLEEARQVELSESGIRKLPKNDSLLAKMFGRRPKS